MKKISLCEFVEILDYYNRTHDYARIDTISTETIDGTLTHCVLLEKANGLEDLIKIPYFEKESILTKEEAIKRHRMMWNWIAHETLRREKRVSKPEAIKHFGWSTKNMRSVCWCCTYAHSDDDFSCEKCPIQWPEGLCTSSIKGRGLYGKWCDTIWHKDDYKQAAEYAYEIANLPERKDV